MVICHFSDIEEYWAAQKIILEERLRELQRETVEIDRSTDLMQRKLAARIETQCSSVPPEIKDDYKVKPH